MGPFFKTRPTRLLTRPDPNQPADEKPKKPEISKNLDPTRPDPRVDPTRGQICITVTVYSSFLHAQIKLMIDVRRK
jgi:hypothetical protein